MDDQFVPVETWQGHVMVSTNLLPQFAEGSTWYPEYQAYNRNLQDVTAFNSTSQPTVPSQGGWELYVQGEPEGDSENEYIA